MVVASSFCDAGSRLDVKGFVRWSIGGFVLPSLLSFVVYFIFSVLVLLYSIFFITMLFRFRAYLLNVNVIIKF